MLLNGEAASKICMSYKCYFCDKTYASFPYLNNHLQTKHQKISFFNCDFVACLHLFFSSEEEKNEHMKEQHSIDSDGTKILRCVYCDKVYLCPQTLGSHVWNAHRNIIIKCNYVNCNKFLKSEAGRELHFQEEHGKKQGEIQCVYCEKVFESRNSLWAHVHFLHRNVIVKCSYSNCHEYLKSEADRPKHMEEKHAARENVKNCVFCGKWTKCMTRHMRCWHSNDAIKCNYYVNCRNYFKSEADRDAHVKAVHLAEKMSEKVDCIYCDLSFRKGVCINQHIKNCHKGIAIRCSTKMCAQYFKSQEECDKHFKKVHFEREKLKNICCSHCNYKTNSNSCFNQHFKVRHGKDRIKCNKCSDNEKTYTSSEALQQHIKHKHSETITCPHCDKSMNKYKMTAHMFSEYCDLCNVNYPCTLSMKEHKKWCKQKCEICLKGFTGIQLLKHVKNEHKVVDVQELKWLGNLRNLKKIFKCEKCEQYFYSDFALRRHFKMAHKEKTILMSCALCKKQLHTWRGMENHMIIVHKFNGTAK
jgi:hypothetical protein